MLIDGLRCEIMRAINTLVRWRANIVDAAERIEISRLLKYLNDQLNVLDHAAFIDTVTVLGNVRATLEKALEAASKRQVDRYLLGLQEHVNNLTSLLITFHASESKALEKFETLPEGTAPPPEAAERPASGGEPHEPEPVCTDVKLSAASPDSAAPGEQFVVRFVAYPATAEEEQAARDLLRTASPSATVLLGKVACRWADGTEVTVRASGDHLEVKQAEKHFTWHGKCQSLDFLITLDRKARARKVFLQIDVLVAGMVIGDLILEIAVVRGERKKPAQTNDVDGTVVRSAFASYSSHDRAKVALIVGALEQVKIDFFVDCLDINPSEEWKERLRSEIDRRDRFWLFWSKSAAESKWVDWEWRTALAYKGITGIQAYSIEPDVLAPPALSKIQFNNIYALVSQHAEQPRLQ
jgi:hypothetical protein